MKIKVKLLGAGILPEIIKKGDWIDLRSRLDYNGQAPFTDVDGKVIFDTQIIKLGVAMKLPKGFEATLVSRSGTFKHYGCIQTNAFGVIDNTYSGNDDEWGYPATFLKEGHISAGDRVCQFRIQLSQKATLWQKLKWLFSNKIEIVQVDKLDKVNRNGFGSSGKK